MAYPLQLNNTVTVTVHPTFPISLYATRMGICDMAIGGYVRSTKRDKCECPQLPLGNGVAAATEEEVCCLDFSTYYLRYGRLRLTRHQTSRLPSRHPPAPSRRTRSDGC